MKNTYPFAALFAAIALAGCAEDPAIEREREPLDPAKYITVTTEVADGEEWTHGMAETRGTLISSQAEMTDFALFATYTGGADWTSAVPINKIVSQRMIKSGSAESDRDYWTYASGNPVRWETGASATANDRYTFFAYAPFGNSSTNGISSITPGSLGEPVGVPNIAYIVPQQNDNQPDLMIASRRENVRPTGNAVSLAMHHALTAVGFKVIGNGEAISSIAITGFADKAVVALDGDNIAWNPNWLAANGSLLPSPAATAPLTADWFEAGLVAGAAASETGEVMADDGWLMMIPQTLGPEARARVAFTDGRPDMEFILNTQQWTAGSRVTYTIQVSIPTIAGVRNIGTASGVIGYVYNPGKPDHLTLTMAKDDGNDLNGYVYVAYFKFGSLVAMSSQGSHPFTSDDVVAWPTDWATTTNFATDRAAMEAKFAGATAGTQSFSVVPNVTDKYSFPATIGQFPSPAYQADWTMALDDPCDYYFGADGWKTPLRDEMRLWADDPGYSWSVTGTASATNPGLGVFPQASVSLPAAGNRVGSGVQTQGTNGRYLSSNVSSSSGLFQLFTSSSNSLNASTGLSNTGAVRCVKPVVATSLAVTPASQTLDWDAFSRGESVVYDVVADGDWVVTSTSSYFTVTRAMNGTGYNGTITVTAKSDNTSAAARSFVIIVATPRDTALNQAVTVTQGTRGVRSIGNTPGVIGYYWNPGQPNHMQLTMDKDDDGDDTNGIVFVAFFQYGSLVGLSSQNNGPFTSTDVIAWPTDWAADRAAMEAKFSGVAAGNDAYNIIPYASSIPATNDATQALGDPCTYYQSQLGGEWRMPTKAETTTFIGGTGNTTSGLYTYTPASGTQPALGNFPTAPGGPYSLPFTGSRTSGISLSQATSGLYWTSSGRDFLTLSSGSSSYGSGAAASRANAIRCQQVVTPNPLGEVNVNGVIWAMTNVAALGTFDTTDAASYGTNQYNWSQVTGGVSGTTAPGVCPSGWRLPTAQELYDLMAAATNAGTPNGTMTPEGGGNYSTNPGWGSKDTVEGMYVTTAGGELFLPVLYNDFFGDYWSSTESDSSTAFVMSFSPSDVLPATPDDKGNVYSVRCVRTP